MRKITGWLLLALLVSYYGGATLFPHSHTLGDKTITHSHPYLPTSQHTHSSSSLQIIDHLSSPIYIVVAASALVILIGRSVLFMAECSCMAADPSPLCYNLRAPPVTYLT